MIDRGDFWQCTGLIPKGSDAQLRAQGVAAFMEQFVEAVPWMSDRKNALESWDEVKLLDVRLDRLRRWHRPGLLCIGDAAHAMSPVGRIGINLAVQDAVAAARYLAEPLRTGTVQLRDVQRFQFRRWLTTTTQALQHVLHARLIEPILHGEIDPVILPAHHFRSSSSVGYPGCTPCPPTSSPTAPCGKSRPPPRFASKTLWDGEAPSSAAGRFSIHFEPPRGQAVSAKRASLQAVPHLFK